VGHRIQTNRDVLRQFKSVADEFWRHGEQPVAVTVADLSRLLRKLDQKMLVRTGETAGVKLAVVGFGTDDLFLDLRESNG
jgi:hypothetical protein